MNKNYKRIIVTLNIIMLLAAIYWLIDTKETEPLIASIGQAIIIISLFCEKPISGVITRRIKNNSDVEVDASAEGDVITEDVDNSKVKVTTRR